MLCFISDRLYQDKNGTIWGIASHASGGVPDYNVQSLTFMSLFNEAVSVFTKVADLAQAFKSRDSYLILGFVFTL